MISSVFKLSSNFHDLPISGLQIDSGISNFPGNRSCRGGGRAAKIDFCLWTSHATNEVAIHRREGAFPGTKQPSMAADACAASNNTNRTASIVKDLNESILHGFIVNLHTGRCNDGSRECTDFLAFKNLRRDLEVLVTPIRTSANKDFVDRQALPLFKRLHMIPIRVARHLWTDIRHVNFDYLFIFRVDSLDHIT